MIDFSTHHWQLVQKALQEYLQKMERSRPGIHRGWPPSPTSPPASHSLAWGSPPGQCTPECHTPAQAHQHRWVLGEKTTASIISGVTCQNYDLSTLFFFPTRFTCLSINSLVSFSMWPSYRLVVMFIRPILDRPKSVSLMWPMDVINKLLGGKRQSMIKRHFLLMYFTFEHFQWILQANTSTWIERPF